MNTFDPDNQYYMFIRWVRIYVERTPDGNRQSGYWHINGHRPEFTLMNQDFGTEPQSWKVKTLDDNKLQMTGISDSNHELVRLYSRIDKFPNYRRPSRFPKLWWSLLG